MGRQTLHQVNALPKDSMDLNTSPEQLSDIGQFWIQSPCQTEGPETG